MKTVIVLPAYNAAKTLKKTFNDIPKKYQKNVILVDDASEDETINIANSLSINYYKISQNKGYGANQKVCYDLALKSKADIIVMIHPDYQYDPKLIPYFVSFIENNHFEVMLGNRIRTRKESLQGGMPLMKYLANRFLTLYENLLTGQNLGEWHTGMRAYKSSVLNSVDYHEFSDDFLFDTEMLFSIVEHQYRIGDIPVPVRYLPDSSSINWKSSIKYGLGTINQANKYFFKNVLRNVFNKDKK